VTHYLGIKFYKKKKIRMCSISLYIYIYNYICHHVGRDVLKIPEQILHKTIGGSLIWETSSLVLSVPMSEAFSLLLTVWLAHL
jgi:hypothetical protein